MSQNTYGDFRGTFLGTADALQVKTGQGQVHTIIVGTASIGSLQVCDAIAGTTGMIANISLATIATHTLDADFTRGIRIVPSGTNFITVTYQ